MATVGTEAEAMLYDLKVAKPSVKELCLTAILTSSPENYVPAGHKVIYANGVITIPMDRLQDGVIGGIQKLAGISGRFQEVPFSDEREVPFSDDFIVAAISGTALIESSYARRLQHMISGLLDDLEDDLENDLAQFDDEGLGFSLPCLCLGADDVDEPLDFYDPQALIRTCVRTSDTRAFAAGGWRM